MKKSLLFACLTGACLLLGTQSYCKDAIATLKERATIKSKIKPFIEIAPETATYKFVYPACLTFYQENQFSKYKSGFSDISGLVMSIKSNRRMHAKRILSKTATTDYTFEFITSGASNFEAKGEPFYDDDYNGFVQLYTYNFPCSLKIYKGEECIKSFTLDNGKEQYEAMFFMNYTDQPESDQLKYRGFPKKEQIEKSISSNSFEFMKFKYLTEYNKYKMYMEKSYIPILDMLGEGNLKTFITVEFINEKKTGAGYEDLNAKCRELFNLINEQPFDQIIAHKTDLEQLDAYFGEYSKKDGIEKRLKGLCLRNQGIAKVLSGKVEESFQHIKEYDESYGGLFSGLRSILFDSFNIFSKAEYYASYTPDEVFEDATLNYFFDREKRQYEAEKNAKRQLEIEEQLQAKKAQFELDDARAKDRNVNFAIADITYTNSSVADAYCSISFFKRMPNGELDPKCGTYIGGIDTKGDTIRERNINDIRSIKIKGDNGRRYDVVYISGPLLQNYLIAKTNMLKLLLYVKNYKGFNIYNDQTQPEDVHYVIYPINNNPKRKGFELKTIIAENKFPTWLKSNENIKNAFDNKEITNDEEGIKKLIDLIEQENITISL